MIRYRLRCSDGHGFEAWFRSSGAFEAQQGTEALACPVCGTQAVERALMAPAIARGGGRGERSAGSASPPSDGPSGEGDAARVDDGTAPTGPAAPLPADDVRRQQMFALLHQMARRMRAEGENVGAAFPEEARRIHEGEAKARDIYGEATPEDAHALLEDGIAILPLPPLPEDRN